MPEVSAPGVEGGSSASDGARHVSTIAVTPSPSTTPAQPALDNGHDRPRASRDNNGDAHHPPQDDVTTNRSSDKVKKAKKERDHVIFPPCVVHSLQELSAMTAEAEAQAQASLAASARLSKRMEDSGGGDGDARKAGHFEMVNVNGNADLGGNSHYSPQHTPNPQSTPVLRASASTSSASGTTCMSRLSNWISVVLETSFYNIGIFVGTYPWLTIVVMGIICGLCGIGMKTFHETNEQEKLWVPSGSRLLVEKAWVDNAFPLESRYVTVLVVQDKDGGDILTPRTMNALCDYYEEAVQYKVGRRTYDDLCLKAGPVCYVSSLLELWYYNTTLIRSLTKTQIVQRVNNVTISPISGMDVKTLLGGDIERDANGLIIRVEATQITWLLKEEEENSDAAAWEKHTINIALDGHPNISSTYVYGTRSFLDEGYGAIDDDVNLLTTGFSIVFVFVMLALGKFNLLEQKIYVSIAGILCVGLAILVAYGLATAMNIIYSPIQSIMPFLILGIGVDDMFVVVETWKNLRPEEAQVEVPKKLALTLSRSGVGITVTSITDIVAFSIGASTVIPALSAFCIYASLGVMAMYVLVSTLFSAVLAIDEMRVRSQRDACLPCINHGPNYQPYSCTQGASLLQIFFGRFYGPFITKKPVKVIVTLIAVGMASVGLWRFILMEHDFDLVNYIPSSSYAHWFVRAKRDYFEREGISTNIYCGDMNYFEQRHRLDDMYTDLTESPDVQPGTIRAWFKAFNHTAYSTEEEYYEGLLQFLQSPVGAVYQPNIKLQTDPDTAKVSIKASYITMNHVHETTVKRRVESMDNLRGIIDTAGLPKFSGPGMPEYMCLAYCTEYMSYETNKVLQLELYRNLALAAVAVFVVTFVLIANIWTSSLVFICVFFTVVDVGGVLELWGTTIDTASSILLTLCVGLAVDFSAHIGHTFMTIPGTRKARAQETLRVIGPAVFNGGFSTFLAFVLLSRSKSYGFILFFRVFFSVVVFGMFHGLVFLPVILSTIGSPAYGHIQHGGLHGRSNTVDAEDCAGEGGQRSNVDVAQTATGVGGREVKTKLSTMDNDEPEHSEMNGHTEPFLKNEENRSWVPV